MSDNGPSADLSQLGFVSWPGNIGVAEHSSIKIPLSIGDGGTTGPTPPPVITAISPTPGIAPGAPGGFSASYGTASVTPIDISITSTAPGLALSFASVRHAADDPGIVAYTMHDGIQPGFQRFSIASPISGGFELFLLPDDDWPSAVSTIGFIIVDVSAVDRNGNTVVAEFIYEMPPVSIAPPTPGGGGAGQNVAGSGVVDQTLNALGRVREQFRSHDTIPTATPAAVPASLMITGVGAQLQVRARVAGTNGNSITLANDALAGVEPPTITDSGATVQLSSTSAATFQEVADAINASSELVTAAVFGSGAVSFASVTSAFSGSLEGGTDSL